MADIWTMGELLVEIMRPQPDLALREPGPFQGPFPSGAPAIFIDTAARLGHSTGIIGGVGDDDFGACLLERLEKDGVDCSQVLKSETGSTGVAFVTYFSDGSRRFLFHMRDTPATEAEAPNAAVLAGIKYFHIMGCSLLPKRRFAEQIVATMHMARSLGARVSFDPNIRTELMKDSSVFDVVREVVAHTNVFLPGVEELLQIAGMKDVQSAVSWCFDRPNIEIVALKKGSRGCAVYTREEMVEMGVYPVTPVDATGAGDCFDGAFICGLLEGKSLEEAARMASVAGALNTAAFGPMEGEISPAAVRKMIAAGSASI